MNAWNRAGPPPWGVDEDHKERWAELLAETDRARAATADGQRETELARQYARGKRSARDRISTLLDPGSFRELGALARPDRRRPGSRAAAAPADGVVVGTGSIADRTVAVASWDFSVLGGSNGVVGGEKLDRLARLCLDHGYPLVLLLDGGGHRIQEGLDSRHFAHGHRFFALQAQLSGWVPMVAVMMGPGFAGPSNHAALADLVVMVRDISTMGVAGPALVAAATGEQIGQEELGGPAAQADRHGIADIVADDEDEALSLVQRYLSYFPSNSAQLPPIGPRDDPPERRDESLLDVVPPNTRRGYDVRRVIRPVIDQGSEFVVKPNYAANAYTALARLDGRSVGIIANQPSHLGGTLDTAACEKIAHLVSLCDAFGLPLVYFIDVPGFLVGSDAERTGLARRSGKLLFELGRATVPRLSVVLRKGYGLAYIAMNGGRSFDADLSVAWPTAEICAMSVAGAVDVAFGKQVQAAADPTARRAELIAEYRSQLGAVHAAEGFGIDDVIDPRDTRQVLVDTLARCAPRRPDRSPPRRHPVTPI